jgi:hypothetical protein
MEKSIFMKKTRIFQPPGITLNIQMLPCDVRL